MKRIIFLLFVLVATSTLFAQTQQGIVKTRGRVVNGEVVPGIRLNGATIILNFGNPLKSDSDGAFSFNVPSGQNYSLVSAKKQGYTLADPEYTSRSFKYSAGNPFYVVLEDEAQRQAELNEARSSIRKRMSAQLAKKDEEIKELKRQNKIDEQEYQRRLAELNDAEDKSHELVKMMAEHFVSTDYDQLDEFNRQVQQYIEEGELLKADSMIQSKGSLEKRIEEYHQVVAANKEERERLKQSEAGAAKTYEELSTDLFNKHTIAMQQYKWDDALMFLKQRADLDTTNVDAVWEYAWLAYKEKRYDEAEKYYIIIIQNEEVSKDIPILASIQNNLGLLYCDLTDYAKANEYLMHALHNRAALYEEDHDRYQVVLARTQLNLGRLYTSCQRYTDAKSYLINALKNFVSAKEQDLEEKLDNMANTWALLGALYMSQKNFSESEKALVESLNCYECLFDTNVEIYRAGLTKVQISLGYVYSILNEYQKAEEYNLNAKNNLEVLVKQDPAAFRYDLAAVNLSLGAMYTLQGDYDKGIESYHEALQNIEISFLQYPDVYRSALHNTLTSLSTIYKGAKNYHKSEELLFSALDICKKSSKVDSDEVQIEMAITYRLLGNLYQELKNYEKSVNAYQQSLSIIDPLFTKDPDTYRSELGEALWGLSIYYNEIGNNDKYATMLDNCLIIFKALYKQSPNIYIQKMVNLQNAKVKLLLQNSDYSNALSIAKETYKLDQTTTAPYLAYALMFNAVEKAKQDMYNDAIDLMNDAISITPQNEMAYDLKGEILLLMGENKNALDMWKKVIELNSNFYDHNGTNLSNGLKKLGLIE